MKEDIKEFIINELKVKPYVLYASLIVDIPCGSSKELAEVFKELITNDIIKKLRIPLGAYGKGDKFE